MANKTPFSWQKSLYVCLRFLQTHSTDLLFFAFPLVLLSVCFFLYSIDWKLRRQITLNRVYPSLSSFTVLPYPLLITSFQPKISAQGAIIMDRDSQTILFSKNPHLHFSMASTTKIMTALVALSHYKMNDILTVMDDNVEGSVAGFSKGERLSFENLLYAMFLPSANDAAYTIAQNYPGGMPNFVAKMNQTASDLHLFDTHYTDPAGLEDDQDYTTVSNLARLGGIASTNQTIAKITSTKEKIISDVTGLHVYDLVNLNKLLGFEGVTGIKTGSTQGAGGVLVTSKTENGKTFIIVVMKSDDRFADTQALLPLISHNINYFSPVQEQTLGSTLN